MSDPDGSEPDLLIITGLSGAGRTNVAKVLEDLGWFVVDNLPPTLIGKVVELASAPGAGERVQRLALVADVRGRRFFGALVDTVRELRSRGLDVRLVFLQADDDTLVRRYEEGRRRHPADTGGGVLDGIQNERALLAELRGMADLVFDTTGTNVHELRDRVVRELGVPGESTLDIKVVSFGFKHGTPRDADVVMDVRFLPNPHWVDELRPQTGRDGPVRAYVLGQAATGPFLERFEGLLDTVVPGFEAEGKRYLTVAIGCTGGRHRSVVIADVIAEHLRDSVDHPVSVIHRDVESE